MAAPLNENDPEPSRFYPYAACIHSGRNPGTSVERRLRKDETLYCKGGPSIELYRLSEDAVKLCIYYRDGREHVVGEMLHGDCLGERGNPVSINTQKTALNALAFLYHKVLNIELGDLDFQHARQYRRLPIVLTPSEVALILAQLDERNRPIFSLLYGSGLRITECLHLRVRDISFTDNSITVRDGKGNKDRKEHSKTDIHHKRVSCHTFRHSFAIQLLEAGRDIRPEQELGLLCALSGPCPIGVWWVIPPRYGALLFHLK